VAYVAADHGARETVEALAARVPGARALGPGTQLLVCGTSDSSSGREIEAQARILANSRGVPCVVVEDYPGNYSAVRAGKPRLLIVAGEFDAHLARVKDAPLDVQICPSVRYDALRRRLADLRSSRPADENGVLWIGQPETSDSLQTLMRLLPALPRGKIWFRAHPRDAGHARGVYADLPVEDMSGRPLEECLARRPRLLVTQFSSVAIEAGFWGIPSLHVLFSDLAGRRLAARKGYSIPPWCQVGAAFLITQQQDMDCVLDRALGSVADRNAVIQSFDRYFQVDTEGVPVLINLLYNQGLL
jgi:hypothetical protein